MTFCWLPPDLIGAGGWGLMFRFRMYWSECLPVSERGLILHDLQSQNDVVAHGELGDDSVALRSSGDSRFPVSSRRGALIHSLPRF
jgi:hypothetical protein